MINSVIKIALSSGDLLDTSTDSISQLRRMGYDLDNNKLDMRTIKSMNIKGIMMDDISLLISRSQTFTKIIAHSHGRMMKDKRENRYYFLYNCEGSNNLLEILKDFNNKAIEESKKNNFEIIKNNKESIFLFENLEQIVKNNISFSKDEDLFDTIHSYLDKGLQPQFETSDIGKAISFFISLDKESFFKNIYYILYIPKRLKIIEANNIINVYVDKEKYIPNIEPIKEFKKHFINYKKQKKEQFIKTKVGAVRQDIESGIINSYTLWKDKRKDFTSEIRKDLAINLFSTVSNFANDIIDEIDLYSGTQSDYVKYNIGKIGDRRFLRLFLIVMIIVVAFVLGVYLSPHIPIIGHSEITGNLAIGSKP